MYEETWSRAMNDISDSELESAMDFYHRKKRSAAMWKKVAAVAAAVAILVTALVFWPESTGTEEPGIIAVPGVMKVYACDLEGMSTEKLPDYELTDTKNFYRMISNPLLSGNFFTSLSFQIPEDYFGECEVTFEITSDYAGFCQDTTLRNGENIGLDSRSVSDVMRTIFAEVGDGGEFYLDIMIYADGYLVGYGVVSFCFCGPVSYVYEFSTVCFPMVDDQFQDVSTEYVLAQMEVYKEAKVPGEGAEYIRQVQEEKKK